MMEIENIFFMYYVNVYELDDIIFVMDVVFYFDVLLLIFFEMDILMNKIRGDNFFFKFDLRRYEIDLKVLKMIFVLFDINLKFFFVNMLEVFIINEKYRLKYYCFVYGVVFKSDNKIWGNFFFVKKDVCNVFGDLLWFIFGYYFMEGWFVLNFNGLFEDDGVFMVLVFDGNIGKSYILFFDLKIMKLIIKVFLLMVVFFYFYGRFFGNVYQILLRIYILGI